MEQKKPVGRFAPTPSGRMHLGNVFAALLSYLSARSADGTILLRMEDLDPQRTKPEYAQLLRQDLQWLGLTYDYETPPQSTRSQVYEQYLHRLKQQDLIYPCYCTRAQLHSLDAPHGSDGTYVYAGTCRHLTPAQQAQMQRPPAWRLKVPGGIRQVEDLLQGTYREDLSLQCGDFLLRRGDGAFMYQLAVTVDDGESGVTQVVRGVDLLSSVPRQMYLQELFGFSHPQYAHIPLLLSPDGRRLSKRDRDMDLGYLQTRLTPQALWGVLAHGAGILPDPSPISLEELVAEFSWDKVKKDSMVPDLGKYL